MFPHMPIVVQPTGHQQKKNKPQGEAALPRAWSLVEAKLGDIGLYQANFRSFKGVFINASTPCEHPIPTFSTMLRSHDGVEPN